MLDMSVLHVNGYVYVTVTAVGFCFFLIFSFSNVFYACCMLFCA